MATKPLPLLRFINRYYPTLSNSRVIIKTPNVNYCSLPEKKQSREEKLTFYDDPDVFGTLSSSTTHFRKDIEDEGDVKEEKLLEQKPLDSQKLTTKQYADIIKQYLQHKRLKQAIEVLEVRMLTEDRVQPENYIYNILIGACADVGYTKKAFKLYNDMKRRALKVTGDTYTCLFNACANSPWPADGLHRAKHLRELMLEKGVEPNLTNYNAMIKAFGRCGDSSTAFQIVDEMRKKKIKIRVHTFNFLLQSCISDKEMGLRHAILVWRQMLKMREKPNIYTCNLMLKCVKECNLGSKQDIISLIETIENNNILIKNPNIKLLTNTKSYQNNSQIQQSNAGGEVILPCVEQKCVPNLLSMKPDLQEVLSLQEISKTSDKFNVIGGMEDFLRQMEMFSVKPDIKTFTQMLFLIEDTEKDEMKLLELVKAHQIKVDIDFYNMLIKKRCLRLDYTGAFAVRDLVKEENKLLKKRHPLKKKLKLNVITYGVLAMACDTQEKATQLLQEMKEDGLKVNAEILGALLKQGTYKCNFGYVLYIMNIATNEKVQLNKAFLNHLEQFNEKCLKILDNKSGSDIFIKSFKIFQMAYTKWLKENDVEETLKKEHPWEQFREDIPEPLQREFHIEEPKKFYKRNRKYVPYIVK